MADEATLTVSPIGVVRTPYVDRYRAPRQPGAAPRGERGTIELYGGRNFEQAVRDLEGIERIWVIYWFHRNAGWKPMVLPPRGGPTKRGVFATRSPHRPNPIGLSLVRLLSVRGRTLEIDDVDMLDGTPVLDLKPYLPYAEAHPSSSMGWLDAVHASDEEAAARFEVVLSDEAREQLAFLRDEHGIDLMAVAEPVLARDPYPHPYRRTEHHPQGGFQIAVKSWRLRYALEGAARVRVERVASGYSAEALAGAGHGGRTLLDEAAHRAFVVRYG